MEYANRFCDKSRAEDGAEKGTVTFVVAGLVDLVERSRMGNLDGIAKVPEAPRRRSALSRKRIVHPR